MLSSIVGALDEVAAVASTTPDKVQATIQQQAEDNIMASGIKDWYRRDLCIVFDLNAVVWFTWGLQQTMHMCSLNSFFELVRDGGYSPVVLHGDNLRY